MVLVVRINRTEAEKFKKWLSKTGLLLKDYPITKDKDYVFFPVKKKIDKTSFNLKYLKMKLPKNEKPKKVLLPYDIIGDVCIFKQGKRGIRYSQEIKKLLSIYKFLKSFYLKIGEVEGVERVPRLKFLYGEDKPLTLHKENGLFFWVDVKKVYFNPRLSHERMRIASLIENGKRVLDMFAGVGPFAITIAKYSKAFVDAVDINPIAYELMKRNIQLNKVEKFVNPYNTDIRNFYPQNSYDHIIMNLPFESIKYLDLAKTFCKKRGRIHIYIANPSDINSLIEKKSLTLIRSQKVFEYAPRKAVFRYDLELR
jgi:tRNA (guanine37-N1)-methyltransferase